MRYKDKFPEWEERLVKGFYDSLYAYPTTRSVFTDDERPASEKNLRDWLEEHSMGHLRTVTGNGKPSLVWYISNVK